MKRSTKTHLWFEIFMLFVLALLWGSSYLFIKIAIVDISPITLMAVRVSIAAMFLRSIMFWQGLVFPRDWNTWKMLFIQAIFNSIGAWTILAWGQQHISSALASVLNSTTPIFVFFIALFFTRHESVNMVRLFGALLGVFGVGLTVGVGAMSNIRLEVAGQLAALFGAFLYACAAIYGKNFSHLSAVVTSAGTMLWATICLVPLSLLMERPWEIQPSIETIGATLILAIFCTGFALLIYFRLVKTLGPMGVASQAYLRASVGLLLGVVFLGEQISLVAGLGIVATILSVVVINMSKKSS